MPSAVFVAPFLMETTLRFVDAVASLPGVRTGLISQDPAETIPEEIRHRLDAHYRVDDGLDPQRLEQAVRELGGRLGGVDVLVATLEQLQVPVARVRESLGIAGMGVEEAINFRDKARMKAVLRAAGVPCAGHALCGSAEEVRSLVDAVGLPVVAKPPAGAGALNTFRVDTAEQLDDWLHHAPPTADQPAQVEQFLVGEEHSFDSICVDGRIVWHSISRYLPTPLDVLRTPWIQWVVLLPRDVTGDEFQVVREVAPRALAALGLRTGMSHMEWFRLVDGSVAVSEVAARPPGAQITTLLSYAHDVDFYGAWARLMVLGEFDPPPRRYAVGAAYLRGQGQGDRVRAVHGLEEAQREVAGLVVEARLPHVGDQATGTYEGDGYVIVRHEETAVVERALERIIEVVKVELG